MRCPKCSVDNSDDAAACVSCGALLCRDEPRADPFRVGINRLATIILIPVALSVLANPIMAVPALILAIVVILTMDTRQGRFTGTNIASAVFAMAAAAFAIWTFTALICYIRQMAFRLACGTNLGVVGKAMLVYANDNNGALPRAGGPGSQWTGRIADWTADSSKKAYGLEEDGNGGHVSISASLYLLVRYAEVEPRSFVCIGDRKLQEFTMQGYRQPAGRSTADVWDFGPEPMKHCGYDYHTPYNQYALTMTAQPGIAVAGDRNPWQASRWAKGDEEWELFDPNRATGRHRHGNAPSHQNEGQNVLFLDSHVEFAKKPTVGINDDNIYTSWDALDISKGVPPTIGSEPAGETDSLLVHDGVGTVGK